MKKNDVLMIAGFAAIAMFNLTVAGGFLTLLYLGIRYLWIHT